MNWEKLKIFYHVAKAGSFTHAGHQLNISQSSLSRQIGDLEDRLKIKLFKRYSGGVTLTQEGEFLFKHAEKMHEATTQAEKFLLADMDEQQTELKILVTPLLGASWLMPKLRPFIQNFPNTRLSIVDSGKLEQLHEYDVIISESLDDRQDLIQKKIASLKFLYGATRTYLDTFGTPKTFDDLNQHRLICLERHVGSFHKTPTPMTFHVPNQNKTHPFLRVNSVQALVNAALSNLGIIEIFENYPGLENPLFEEVLIDIQKNDLDIYCIYPTEYATSPRVKAFRESLTESLTH